jgi:hypothetical protein
MNQKKLRRLYRDEGVQVCRRCGCKRAVGCKTPITIRGLTKTSLGAWTLAPVRYPMAVASDLGDRRSLPTRRYRTCVLCVSSISSLPRAVVRP